jgi:amidase
MLGKESKTTLLQYKLAQEEQVKIRESWERFFNSFDVLICPALATNAFPKDESPHLSQRTLTIRKNGKLVERPYGQSIWWATLTNVGLLPSTTFPCGLGRASGLPCGLEVVSKEYNDLITIDFARLLKAECGYDFQPPPGFGPLATRPAARL